LNQKFTREDRNSLAQDDITNNNKNMEIDPKQASRVRER
jgi:hypothetical protein